MGDIALNFWWSWSSEQLSLFRDIDYEKWDRCCHNPVKLLNAVSDERLTELATDPQYCDPPRAAALRYRVEAIAAKFEQYRQQTNTWASVASQFKPQQPVAYFSIEFGLHPCLPTYSGGLGILAADHLKSASDLGLPLVAVNLIYRQGYFQQRLSSTGWQEEHYRNHQLHELPLELCFDRHGEQLTITVQICDIAQSKHRCGWRV